MTLLKRYQKRVKKSRRTRLAKTYLFMMMWAIMFRPVGQIEIGIEIGIATGVIAEIGIVTGLTGIDRTEIVIVEAIIVVIVTTVTIENLDLNRNPDQVQDILTRMNMSIKIRHEKTSLERTKIC